MQVENLVVESLREPCADIYTTIYIIYIYIYILLCAQFVLLITNMGIKNFRLTKVCTLS